VQGAEAPPSSEQLNVDGSLDTNVKVALVLEVDAGGVEVIVVFGAIVSTTQVKLAGDGSGFPIVSIARTLNV
jgi:hypothetical protein